MTIMAEYPRKDMADFTADDQLASRRYAQGKAHGLQGRMDLIGQCVHYDRGHRDCSAQRNPQVAV